MQVLALAPGCVHNPCGGTVAAQVKVAVTSAVMDVAAAAYELIDASWHLYMAGENCP